MCGRPPTSRVFSRNEHHAGSTSCAGDFAGTFKVAPGQGDACSQPLCRLILSLDQMEAIGFLLERSAVTA